MSSLILESETKQQKQERLNKYALEFERLDEKEQKKIKESIDSLFAKAYSESLKDKERL